MNNVPEGPRKSKAQRKMDALVERQRKLDADMAAARIEIVQEDEREKEQRGAEAFIACVRRLDRRHLDLLKGTVLADSDGDKFRLGLVKEWLDGLAITPPPQGATNLSDRAEVSAAGISSDDSAARPGQQPAISDSTPLQTISPEATQNPPTEKASAKPADADRQADTAPTSRTLPEPAVGHQTSAGNVNEPVISQEGAVGSVGHTQTVEGGNPDNVPAGAIPNALTGKQPTESHAEAQASATPPANFLGIPPAIEDRQWHGDYLIEVWQKGGCQVIGMEVFSNSQEAMEQLDWLTEGAKSGDENSRNMLATARKAAMEYEPKPPKATPP